MCLLELSQKFFFDISQIEIRFDIYVIEYFKSVSKGFKFVFSDFFPCKLNFCFEPK